MTDLTYDETHMVAADKYYTARANARRIRREAVEQAEAAHREANALAYTTYTKTMARAAREETRRYCRKCNLLFLVDRFAPHDTCDACKEYPPTQEEKT